MGAVHSCSAASSCGRGAWQPVKPPANPEELHELRELIQKAKLGGGPDERDDRMLARFSHLEQFQDEMFAEPQLVGEIYLSFGAASAVIASLDEDALRVKVDEGLDLVLKSQTEELRRKMQEGKDNYEQVLVQIAAGRYDCWTTFKDTVLPTLDVTLDIVQGVTYWQDGHFQWLQILGCAVAFNGTATAIFEGFCSDRRPPLGDFLPNCLDVKLPCVVWRDERCQCIPKIPAVRVLMALLNVCSGGTIGLVLESARCYKTGSKTQEMVMYKVSESVESIVSLIVASYSLEVSGLLEGYPRLSGLTLWLRIGSVCSSLVCLPLTGLDVNKHFLFRSSGWNQSDEAVKAMKNMFLTWGDKLMLFLSHVGEVASHMVFVTLALATRPFGIFWFGGGCVAVILAVGFIFMLPLLATGWTALVWVLLWEAAKMIRRVCKTCHLSRFCYDFCVGLFVSPLLVLGLPLLTVFIPICCAVASPLVGTMDISSKNAPPEIQLLFLFCRNSIWLAAWGVLIQEISSDERLLEKLTSDWYHIFIMVVPLAGLVLYSFAFAYQCYIGRFSGWLEGATRMLRENYGGQLVFMIDVHPLCCCCNRYCEIARKTWAEDAEQALEEHP